MENAVVKLQAPAPIPQEATFTDILERTKSRLEELIKSNPDAVMEISGRYEITRPVALAIKSFIRDTILAIGGSVRFSASQPQVIEGTQELTVKVECLISLPSGQVIEESALGSCSMGEISAKNEKNIRTYHDAVATAETRALKRLIEHILGEDVINRLILEVKGSFEPQDKEELIRRILERVRKINEQRQKKGKKPLTVRFFIEEARKRGWIKSEGNSLEDLTEDELKKILKGI